MDYDVGGVRPGVGCVEVMCGGYVVGLVPYCHSFELVCLFL